ncbi:hypothetical protein DDT91_03555 [Algoriphagus sp. AK58]|nr:hypothetical protein [Algoriphagus sp. AK58]
MRLTGFARGYCYPAFPKAGFFLQSQYILATDSPASGEAGQLACFILAKPPKPLRFLASLRLTGFASGYCYPAFPKAGFFVLEGPISGEAGQQPTWQVFLFVNLPHDFHRTDQYRLGTKS